MSKFPSYLQSAYPFLEGASDLAQMFVANECTQCLVPYGTANYGEPKSFRTVQPVNFVTPTGDFVTKANNVGTMVVALNGLRQSKYFTAGGPTTNYNLPQQTSGATSFVGFEVDVQPGGAGGAAQLAPTAFGLLRNTASPIAIFSRPTILDTASGSDGLGWCWDLLVPQASAAGGGVGNPNIYALQYIPDTPPAPGDTISLTLWLHRTVAAAWEPHNVPYTIPPYFVGNPQLQCFILEFSDGVAGGPYGGAVNGVALSVATSSNYGPVASSGKLCMQILAGSLAGGGTVTIAVPPVPQRLVGYDVQDFQKMVRLGVTEAVETSQNILLTVTTAEAAVAGEVVAGDLDCIPEISTADLLGTLMAVPRNMVSRSFKQGVHTWRLPSRLADFDYSPITECKRNFYSIVYAEAPTSSFGAAAGMCTISSTVQLLTNNPLLSSPTYIHPNVAVLEGVLTLLRALPRATANDEHIPFGEAVKGWIGDWHNWFDLGKNIGKAILPVLSPRLNAFATSAGGIVHNVYDQMQNPRSMRSSKAATQPVIIPPPQPRGRSRSRKGRSRSRSRAATPRGNSRGRSRSRKSRSRSRSRGRVRIST